MTAEYHCLVHGLVVRSEVELPLLHVAPQKPDVIYRLAPGMSLPPSSHRRADNPDDPWAVEHWLDDRLAVEFPGRATFVMTRNEVALVSDESGDPDLLIHLLLDHVLPRVVALRGDLMLHAAGAVGPSGRAHLFLGPTGAGKSTLVTALVVGGWLLLDDDGVRLARSGDGFRALPGAPGVRLLPDAATALVAALEPGPRIGAGSAKRRFAVDGKGLPAAAEPAPIAGLYVLARSEEKEPSVERLGFADSLGTISEHGFHLADEPATITRRAFERASSLAASAPVWRLCCPTGLDSVALTARLVVGLDSAR